MSTPAKRRLMRDFKRITSDCPPGLTASPLNDNVMVWNAVIIGPEGTAYEDGIFKLVLQFSEEYPNKPPDVRFVSKIYHPNFYNDGKICLDILQNRWTPTYDVSSILTSIQSLFNDPNPESPANVEAANLYKDNKMLYLEKVKECVELSWQDDIEDDDEEDDDEEEEE
ncbi:hypothetical protein QEN19_000255 [Hanseniaspora menglaensis]